MVPVTGVEPVRCLHHWILSPARLPIPSHRQNITEIFYHSSSILSTTFIKLFDINKKYSITNVCYILNGRLRMSCNMTAYVDRYRKSGNMRRSLLNVYRQRCYSTAKTLRTNTQLIYFIKHFIF